MLNNPKTSDLEDLAGECAGRLFVARYMMKCFLEDGYADANIPKRAEGWAQVMIDEIIHDVATALVVAQISATDRRRDQPEVHQ